MNDGGTVNSYRYLASVRTVVVKLGTQLLSDSDEGATRDNFNYRPPEIIGPVRLSLNPHFSGVPPSSIFDSPGVL